MIKSINPKEISIPELHGLLLGAIAPRPIAFASTIACDGKVNLSPFSFFNVFSANPPILIFSPARRVRDNTIKHTLQNIIETKEVAINIVNYAMAEQMSLSSSEYPYGVNEFEKAGFTQLVSDIIKPPRVKESPVSFECKVNDIIHLGSKGGAGNLIICEVKRMHIDTKVIDENNKIDPFKIDLVSRMGDSWYCRADENSLFKIQQPKTPLGIGFDNLPSPIINSKVLTGNELAKLAAVQKIPPTHPLVNKSSVEVDAILNSQIDIEEKLHQLAKKYIKKNEINTAWQVLIAKK